MGHARVLRAGLPTYHPGHYPGFPPRPEALLSTVIQAQRSAAWPTLLGVQALVVMALALVGWEARDTRSTTEPSVRSRLEAMDVTMASAAVETAIAEVRDGAAVMAADELRVTSFLSLTARGADLEVSEVRLVPLEQQDVRGVQIVEAVLDVSGHLYDLPIFLDGAHRQRALGRLKSMAIDVEPGGLMQGQVRLNYYRPRAMDTTWVSDRLAIMAPGASELVPVLEQAASLAAWRAFSNSQPDRAQKARHARSRAANELPANLIELQSSGGRFVWDADVGIVIR